MRNEISVRMVYSLARDRAKRSEFADEGPFCAWLDAWWELNTLIATHDPGRLGDDCDDEEFEGNGPYWSAVWARMKEKAIAVREALKARRGPGKKKRSTPRRPRARKRPEWPPSLLKPRGEPSTSTPPAVAPPEPRPSPPPAVAPPLPQATTPSPGPGGPSPVLLPGKFLVDGVVYPRDVWEGFPGRRPSAELGMAPDRDASRHARPRLRPGQRLIDGVAYPRDVWEGFVPGRKPTGWLHRLRRWLLGA